MDSPTLQIREFTPRLLRREKKYNVQISWPLYAVVVGRDMAFQPDYVNSDNDKSKAL